ncbi:hypothetical protein MMC07_001424 [Pseudocyphellaria aurata]|nr:hypothetical protein [Pseudocyphellaria aurata]
MYPSLWYDKKEDILYSGISGWVSIFGDAPSPSPLSLWSFKPDGTGSGSWTEVIDSGSPVWDSISRPGSPMSAFGSDSAYVLGGFEDWATNSSITNHQEPAIGIPGLIQFNMTTKEFSNSTVSGYSLNGTAEKGEMHYVPSFGPEGLFVVMGGDDVWHPGSVRGLRDLETVSIYDPSSRQWFNQTTTGNIPQARMEFCLAGLESNNGTYEILMYAGWGLELGAAAIPFDEIYILTLPAFYWIKVDYTPQHPRHGHTCNPVGGSQVLTIGGLDTNSSNDSYYSPFDTSADPFTQGLAIFDMTRLQFADQFTANAPSYVQSDRVKAYYETRPTTHFASPELAQLISVTHFANTTTSSTTNSSSSSPSDSSTFSSRPAQPPSSNTSHKSPGQYIAGGVAGGVAFLVLLGALIFFVRRRRKSHGPEPVSYAEAFGEPKHRPDPGPRETVPEMEGDTAPEMEGDTAPEVEGDLQQTRAVELSGKRFSPPEMKGDFEVAELKGSAHQD